MRSLKQPKISSIKIYDNIAAAKQSRDKAILKQLKRRIKNAYSLYKFEQLSSLANLAFTDIEKSALLNCYINSTQPLTGLKQAVLELAGSICPYCGLDRPQTLDHYIPKDEFPEFSVHSLNLIACCYICNQKKATNWLVDNNRCWLHAYLDRLPADATYIQATLVWSRGKPEFGFKLNSNAVISPTYLFDIVKTHIDKLGLLQEYKVCAAEEFSSNDWMQGRPIEEIPKIIQNHIEKRRKKEGPLSWKAALWEAVLSNEDALNYLSGN